MSARALALLGGGNMGGALAAGLLAAGTHRPGDITVAEIDGARRAALRRKLRVNVTADVRAAVRNAGTVLLAVKPQQMGDALRAAAESVRRRPLVISVAAGVTTATIEAALGEIPVVRAMPNTPALLRAGATAYCLGRWAGAVHAARARRILSAVGPVWRVDEGALDAVTALSGSGPAYVFYLAEALAEAGAALGLDPAVAEGLTRQTVYGAGRMLAETRESASQLRRRVTSPGGTTQAALETLEGAGVRKIFERALDAARRRSLELSSAARVPAPPKESNP